MDVTTAEHKELEDARKEASKLKNEVPEMTTGAVKRRIRVLKARAAPGPSGLRNNHIRAIAAMIVPLDRDGTRVRPIALTEALVKLAQGTLMERLHKKLRKKRGTEQNEKRRNSTTYRTILGTNANGS